MKSPFGYTMREHAFLTNCCRNYLTWQAKIWKVSPNIWLVRKNVSPVNMWKLLKFDISAEHNSSRSTETMSWGDGYWSTSLEQSTNVLSFDLKEKWLPSPGFDALESQQEENKLFPWWFGWSIKFFSKIACSYLVWIKVIGNTWDLDNI